MLTYNQLSFYLQFAINATLLVGFALLIWRKHSKKLLFIFFLGELIAELPDLIFRLIKVNTANMFIYPFSQSFCLLMMTEIYSKYFFKIPFFVKYIIYFFAGFSLLLNFTHRQGIESITFYHNIITDIVICSFAAVYFMHVFKNPGIDKALLTANVFIFLFFSIESIVSTMFSFLISHHLQWVAPVWLFRGVLLWFLYITFINLGWKTGEVRT